MQLEMVVKSQTGEISTNFDEIKQGLEVAIKPYENLLITEDSIKEGKNTRADLNKIKKAIDDKRKSVKAEYTKPLVEYENKCKELIAIIDRGVLNIDTQVKEYEEKDKEEKKLQIEEYFKSLRFFDVKLERLFDEKWLNRTCSENTWKAELNGKVECIKADISFLNNQFKDEDLTNVLDYYLESLSVQQAMTRLSERKERLDKINTINQELNKQGYNEPKTVNEEDLLTRSFRVTATKEQIIALGEFMNKNGIKFIKI